MADQCKKCERNVIQCQYSYAYRVMDFCGWLDDAPTIDAVPVVRCKNCKHLFDGERTENCCDVLMEKTGWLTEISVSPDWYCADGERRTNVQTD